ncbi:hypothetical protein DUI87_30460 [Hirundo rustica rustica]|uniref:ribonuclease H n=1 Tax=Hirundo rustica rustica TaxID=333673 RepID=A0A3M0IXC1_HIRRU|nr:hypothetical protein DUI87_30460 [Hirundo rustica rustica]
MHRHTTLDPGSDEGTQQFINLFLGQSTGDIRRKLQKIQIPNSQNLETLLDKAWRAFSNWEEEYKPGVKKLVAVVKEGEKGKRSNLLGRDLQVKLGIGVIPEDGKMTAKVLKLGQEDEEKINQEVWAGEENRGGLNIDPISVTIEREDCPIRVHQYPISLEGQDGLKPVIEGLIKDRTLEPCMSPHNTPILPVKKPDGSYRLLQDLREVNKRTRSRYPVVPNLYTLLSKVPPQHRWFSVVDLKDAFWAYPLAKESRDIFAFEWEDPKTRRKQQLRWTKLPQGFTESPNLFGQALEKILQAFSTPPRIQIIQYVDDLLLSEEEEVREATIKLLHFLGEKGLRVSKWKLQFVEPEVLLTTEAAIQTKERGWIHASRIKGPVEEPKEWTITSEPGDTKLTLKWGLGGNELGRPKWSKKHTQDHT